MVGTSVGSKSFSDLDFADDVAPLAEMLSLLVLALEIMDEEAGPLGLTISWSKTMLDPAPVSDQVRTINGHGVEVVVSFPYLGSPMQRALKFGISSTANKVGVGQKYFDIYNFVVLTLKPGSHVVANIVDLSSEQIARLMHTHTQTAKWHYALRHGKPFTKFNFLLCSVRDKSAEW